MEKPSYKIIVSSGDFRAEYVERLTDRGITTPLGYETLHGAAPENVLARIFPSFTGGLLGQTHGIIALEFHRGSPRISYNDIRYPVLLDGNQLAVGIPYPLALPSEHLLEIAELRLNISVQRIE